MKKLTTVSSVVTAHLLKGKLENEGFHVVTTNELSNQLYGGINSGFSAPFAIDIFVADDELEAAEKLLQETDNC